MVVAPGYLGELAILPNHSNLLTTLNDGEIKKGVAKMGGWPGRRGARAATPTWLATPPLAPPTSCKPMPLGFWEQSSARQGFRGPGASMTRVPRSPQSLALGQTYSLALG